MVRKWGTFLAQIAQSSSLTASVPAEVPESGMAKKKRPRFLTTDEAAEFLRLKRHTLENMRSLRTGPPARKHGGRVFYHVDDLIAWSKNTRRKT